MSDQNVELVRKSAEAFNRGGIEALRAFADPQIEFHEPPEQPAPRVARGWDETLEMWREFDSAWESHQTEIEELRPLGDDRILLLSIEHFVGRDGMTVDAPFAGIVTIKDGKILRWQAFWDRSRAFAAAGLDTT
jgi:ketosteroid isomerase-like protein